MERGGEVMVWYAGFILGCYKKGEGKCFGKGVIGGGVGVGVRIPCKYTRESYLR